jgi:hypothetical protein
MEFIPNFTNAVYVIGVIDIIASDTINYVF